MMFDLIIQNNSSRETFIYSGLTNVSGNHLYLEFDDLEMDVPSGEYTYVVIPNNGSGITYTTTVPILDTVASDGENEIKLRYLHPRIGLLRVGEIEDDNIFEENEKNNEFIYYEG